MLKRIVYLAAPVVIIVVIGLIAVQNYFSSFPPSKKVIEKFTPRENVPTAIDITESFIDDSGSMKGYHGEQYVKFLRGLKAHIRERGKYQYHAFSGPEKSIEGDAWDEVENVRFYSRNNTYIDSVLGSISKRVGARNPTAKNYLLITDGIQDVAHIQDYSRIVNKVSDLLDAGLFFQIIAIKLPFRGYKYPEGGSFISYKGDSPLYCYIFSYQPDFARGLYKKLIGMDLTVEFLEFGNKNINALVKQFSDPAKNRDGSKNTFRRFRDEPPVTYLVSRSGSGGTLLANIALNVKGVNLDNSGFRQKIPEFCGKCLPIGDSGDVRQDLSKIIPNVMVTVKVVEALPDADGNTGIEYSLYFTNWDRDAKTVACELALCNWLPVNPPDWVAAWSSDCDNSSKCFEGKTPFLINIINPILNKSVRKYTLGYAVIRN